MPAHTTVADVGKKQLSNGTLLSATDRASNDKADKHAKAAAYAVRVPVELRQDHDDYARNIFDAAIWLGLATWMAGNMQGSVKRDSTASALKALRHRSVQQAIAKDRRSDAPVRLPSEGGHLLLADGQMHWCAMCGDS